MQSFFPGQRWTSEGEPELGVGVIAEVSKSRVHVHFPLSGEARIYSSENAPIRRVVFKPGDTIIDDNGRSMLIENVANKENLIFYIGQGRTLPETELGDVKVKEEVLDLLLRGDVESPENFALRRQTLYNDFTQRSSAILGFVGGRIDLIPHQLFIAHEVSSRYAPRVLLSDQVGLGKTIEACLIVHRLLLSGRISRVLILVPESLVHQWFVEILRRFNLWFHIYDEERCKALEQNAPEGNPFLDDQLIICSTSFLSSDQIRVEQALLAGWDMLVVDEAHHLKWSPKAVSPEYSIVELLSKQIKGLLLLTATPEQLGIDSHFARLRLLDPDRYSDIETFKKESDRYKEIAGIVEKLTNKISLNARDISLLESIFSKTRISTLEQNNQWESLIAELLDQYGPGRVVFRNTRSAMSGFPKRKVHLNDIGEISEKDLWIKRFSQELLADIDANSSSAIEQKFWFDNDPRIHWLIGLMQKIKPSKAVLICRTKEKVFALEKSLKESSNMKVGVFHEDLSIVQRDRNAAWFAESNGARLLLCSEIGSEGRNFQFAHHLILFDLPLNPELLEQRIGRLDRIGQTKDINIYTPFLKGSPQEALLRWFHEGLNAFEENIEGGNQISDVFGERLKERVLSVSQPESDKSLELLISETSTYHKDLKLLLSNGRDLLLELNSFRPQIARKISEQIKEADSDLSLELFMLKVFEHFGIEVEDLAPRTYLLHPALKNREAFPSIPDEGISVTFDRKRALAREDLSFVSWDHPMAVGSIDMVLSQGVGRASFGVLEGNGKPAILLELIFVLETIGGKTLDVDRFLPTMPLRIVVNHTGEDVSANYSIEKLNQELRPGRIDVLLENEILMDSIFPNMIKMATKIAEDLGDREISKGMKKMETALDQEIERLKSLQVKNNHIRPEEIQIAMDEKLKLTTLIEKARLRLDAIQLIKKGA